VGKRLACSLDKLGGQLEQLGLFRASQFEVSDKPDDALLIPGEEFGKLQGGFSLEQILVKGKQPRGLQT